MGVPVPVTPSGPRGRLGQPGAGGGESQEGLPAAFSAWSQRPSERSVCLVSQIQTALRHKSEIEHHRNKIRLRAKRRGHYEFPVLDELSSGDTRERHRVYRRAQMQIDKILDPTASVPSVFIEPRKRWAPSRAGGPCCRATMAWLWRGRGEVSASDSRLGRLGGSHPTWRSPVVKAAFIPPQWPRSTSLGFVSPGIQTSEKVALSFSEGSRAPSPCLSSSALTPSISTSRAWSPVRPGAQLLSESRSLGLPGPCSLMQRHFV